MKFIGFSTGAVAYSEFSRALRLLSEEGVRAVEISALRYPEWEPLCKSLMSLDLSHFRYVSIHLPSNMTASEELSLIKTIPYLEHGWPLILHPDTIRQFEAWRDFG